MSTTEVPSLLVDISQTGLAAGLKEELLSLSLEQRITYHPARNIIYVNFENYRVQNSADVRDIEEAVGNIVHPLGKKVFAIVNYDNFIIYPEIIDEYTAMVQRLMDNYYTGVTRYTTSTFLRMKLGDALQKRNVAPHIYETKEEAQIALGKTA